MSKIVSVLPNCFTNLTGLSGSTNKISNLDPLAEPFIPGIILVMYRLGGVCISLRRLSGVCISLRRLSGVCISLRRLSGVCISLRRLSGVCMSRSTRNCSPDEISNIETERPSTLGSLFEQDDGVGSPVPPDLLTPMRWTDVSIHVKSSRKINRGRLETAVGGISNSKACQFQNVNEKNPVTSFSNLNPYAEPFPAPVNTGIPRNIPSGNNKDGNTTKYTLWKQ